MAETHLTAERLRELLSYDPETGLFTWLKRRGGKAAPAVVAGTLCAAGRSKGYITIGIDGVLYKAHRLVWLYIHGTWPLDQIDHINSVRHDNRALNLRNVTNSVNQQNQKKARSDNKTGFLGVTRRKHRYEARININGKSVHLGMADTAEKAHLLVLESKRINHLGCTI